jgi:platelet-activating factor acetylhydrolase IB subunit beta/gamma
MRFPFLDGFLKRLRGIGQSKVVPSSWVPDRRSIPLTVEVLEDRCLLSASTTVPEFNPFSSVGMGDMLMASSPKGNSSIVFLGDSITWGFAYGTGAPIWSAFMAPLGAVDYGIIGQTTQSLLAQLSLGQLTGVKPSVVVLTIGTNNLLEGDTPQATAAGILADVNLIHLFQPQAQVLVVGVPPGEASPTNPYRLQVAQTNALLSQMLADDPQATFVNVGQAFEQPDGSISNTVMFDYIHPTTVGYLDWSTALAIPLIQATEASESLPSTLR